MAGVALGAAMLAAGALVVGAPAPAGATPRSTGPVNVLTAGSLETIMKTAVEPGFHAATGYTVDDYSHGSTALAQDIKGGVYKADVFWSASATSDKALIGAKNGSWVSWYITFATTTLVLGYEPKDKFASTIKSEPWWKVITKPGFRVGRTNPVTDPKGRLTVAALKLAARQHDDAALSAIVANQTTIFTETSLVGRLQAGQLDAGFFYAVEASASHFPTVPLTGVTEKAEYTLTVVAKAPHAAAANTFIAWLLSPAAKKLLAAHGLVELSKPVLSGSLSSVPPGLRKVIG
ncbi:MAG TPA: extracellular solute-binding protein [Acidimicrobiales bacterium]|nr:extracellular solute-binding protein [Acidimicrobiales bacterium]